MARFAAILVLALAGLPGCDDTSGESDLIIPLEDQRVRVNETLNLDMRVRNAVGDEQWSYSIPSIPDIDRTATLYQGGGSATFHWAPLASHHGVHQVTFSVTSGAGSDSETINIEVVQAGGAPRFIQPPPGGTFNLDKSPCIDVDIEVVDQDNEMVTIQARPPLIEGGEMTSLGGHRARWHWCPTPQQIDSSLRYTLHFEADDGQHEPVPQKYDIVILGQSRSDCDGTPPVISAITPPSGERLVTIQDYEVRATVADAQGDDEGGIKEDPILYYSTTLPDTSDPDVTQMTTVPFSRIGPNEYQAFVPNLGLEQGREQALYFVISATDNDDPDGTSCDHTTLSQVSQFVAVEPPANQLDTVGYCTHCSADRQCQGGFCVVPESGPSFCGTDCVAGEACASPEDACVQVTSRGGSVDWQCAPTSMRCGVTSCVDSYSDEPANNSLDTAQVIPVGSDIEGHICLGDIDFFWVPLNADTRYQITFLGWDSTTTDIDVFLFSPEGEDLGYGDGYGDVEQIEVCADTTGDHLLLVVGADEDWDQGDYVGEVVAVEGECCVDDENEPDDFVDEATQMVCGDMVEAQLCPTDEDWWQIRATEASELVVNMLCETADTGDLNLEVYRVEGDTMTRLGRSQGADCEEEVTVNLPDAGYYYIRVLGDGFSDFGYYVLDCAMEGGVICESTAECWIGQVCDPMVGCVDAYCTDYGSPEACPVGHLCPTPGGSSSSSFCLESCTSTSECSYGVCKSFPEGRGCAGDGPGRTGDPCVYFDDCAEERICLPTPSQPTVGYCAELGCELLEDCGADPRDSFCVTIGSGQTACLEYCTEGGSECNDNPGACTPTVDTEGYLVEVCALPGHVVPSP